MQLSIVIPAAEAARTHPSLRYIRPGSGIVLREREHAILDFEGNLYGAENLRTYRERLMHAAGRARDNYPTVARTFLDSVEDLVFVGTYDTDTWTAVFSTNSDAAEALRRWVPEEFA